MTIYYAMRNGTNNIFLEMMAPFFWSHHIIPWTDCDCFLICMPTKRFIKYPFSLSKFTHFLARQWDGPLWIIKICCDLKKILMIITPTIGFPGSGGGVKYKFSAGFRKLYSKFSIVIVKIDWVSTYQQKTSIWSSSGKVWSLYDAPLHHYTLRNDSFFFRKDVNDKNGFWELR